MGELPQDIFAERRDATLDRILLLVHERQNSLSLPVLTDIRNMPISSAGAEKEVWTLVEKAVRHLRSAQEGRKAGTVSEALSRISLRNSSLAASLGVKPPQFEPMILGAAYADGHEAAVFLCRRLVAAAEGDLSKSRQIIAQKIFMEKPEASEAFAGASRQDVIALKRQMAHTLEMLIGAYASACLEMNGWLADLAPGPRPPDGARPSAPRR